MDVVVPCYNYGHFLEPLVESVLAQEGVCVRIVIVDDASPDGSGDVADRIARSSSNVQVVRHAQNRGHITTYNEGLAVGDSTYLLLLSADDMLAPGALKRATTIMDRHASVGLVYGFAPDFVLAPPAARRGPPRYTIWPGKEWRDTVCRSGQNPVVTPTAVIRRSVFEAVGGRYDPSLPHAGDLLMWLAVAAVSDVAYVSGLDQGYYRVHGANMHTTSFADLKDDLDQRRAAFRMACSDAPGRLLLAERALDREWREARAHPSAFSLPLHKARRSLRGRYSWRYWRRFGVRP